MHIPDKYRDRYNRLARSHPWMREMRDETETIGDLIERRVAKNEKRKEAVERLRKGESGNLEWMILGDDCPSWVNYDTLSYNKVVHERIADLLEDDTTELTVYNEASDDELFRCSYCHCKVYNIDMTEGDCGWGFTFCPQCGGEVYESDSRKIEAKLGEPTNGIGSETNGIANDSPLVEPCTSEDEKVQGLPDDNVLYLLRDVAKKSDGHTLYHGATKLMQAIGKEPEDRCETGSELAIALNTLAEMVERDYVSRETHSKAADIWQAASGEWRKRALDAEAECDELKAIVDRLKAENAELRGECADCAVKRANRVLSQSVDRLTLERDALAVDLADAMAPHAVDMRVKLDEGAMLPHRAHATDAGADLFAPQDVVIPARGSVVIDTGAHVQIPHGCCGLLVSKSGLNVKLGIESTGLIDEGYSGSVAVKLYNHSDEHVKLPAGSKISQLVVLPVLYPRIVEVDEIASGARGDAGFGSTDAPLTVIDGNGEVVS